jgi:hypothetical protein
LGVVIIRSEEAEGSVEGDELDPATGGEGEDDIEGNSDGGGVGSEGVDEATAGEAAEPEVIGGVESEAKGSTEANAVDVEADAEGETGVDAKGVEGSADGGVYDGGGDTSYEGVEGRGEAEEGDGRRGKLDDVLMRLTKGLSFTPEYRSSSSSHSCIVIIRSLSMSWLAHTESSFDGHTLSLTLRREMEVKSASCAACCSISCILQK